MPARRVAYRDTRTGHFVSAAKYKRSRAHGGRRYKRVLLEIAKPRAIMTLAEFFEEELLEDREDYEGSSDYDEEE